MLEATHVQVYPAELGPELVGQLVGVQVLPRTSDAEVSTKRMIKYVGTLRGYIQRNEETGLVFEGFDTIQWVGFKASSIEFYRYVKVY